ncbi:hypothetical protein GZ77_24055 [Endozoicomonas montiporae]|uniref:Glycosyl transferase family 1 domain-containing protein n=2 Tax=Endozoicomonas montiporae TaxID=1027273 RepID=A0A081MZH7_9GAMM|nr:glycosyltransferase family 4 protein [Endozoicomonas montiporae]AMO54718.1 lipopolysaccharide core biosynthesis protein RfaG [Endozoicomonas montiporae CL-33]KEQ11600.1 hypothetical protein GZ77_24055 [Endozoicomonas montiporae]
MILAFALFKYFPFGGLQRDFLRIALECQKRGHEIRVYTTSWLGDKPEGFDIQILSAQGSSNHRRMLSFQRQVQANYRQNPGDVLIGFNKMAGLDVYYASDTCFKEKALNDRSWLYRLTSRCRYYTALEESVFSPRYNSLILTLTQHQKDTFQTLYGTQAERFVMLPPGIDRNTKIHERENIRSHYRDKLGIPENNSVLLLVASSFKTKGLDRAIDALASLPQPLLKQTKLVIAGNDDPKPYEARADKLGCSQNIQFLGARKDIHELMMMSDLLIHPAYTESAGMVLLEAITCGLPVLTTDICGYAPYITEAKAGLVASSPFNQATFNQLTADMLTSDNRKDWINNGIQFAQVNDLYSQHSKAAEVIINYARKDKTAA